MSSAELPELEILRRDLDKEVSGKKIKAVDVPGKKSIARAGTPKALATRLTGVKIERVARKGTWISLALDSGDVMLVALGAKSRLRRAQNKDALEPGTAVVNTYGGSSVCAAAAMRRGARMPPAARVCKAAHSTANCRWGSR